MAVLYSLSAPWWKGREAWDAQWHTAAEWLRFLLVFLWPLTVGAGAVAGLRDHREGTRDLLATTARPTWHRGAATAGALAICLALGYLAVFALGAAQAVWHGGIFHLAWLPTTAVGALAVVAGGWLGMGLARVFPSVLTPPLLAVSAMVALVFLTISQDPGTQSEQVLPNQVVLLSPALWAVRNVYATVSDAVHLGQAIWLAGLALTGFWLLVAPSARLRVAALVPVVVGAAVALPVLPARTFVRNEAVSALVCRGPACVARLDQSSLDKLAPAAEEALRLLRKLPAPPTSVRDAAQPSRSLHTVPRTPDVVLIHLTGGAFEYFEPADWRTELVAGAGTPTCFTDLDSDRATVRETAARTATAAWFTGRLTDLHNYRFLREAAAEPARQAWDLLRALPPEQQLHRVSAARAVGLSCRGDQLTALTGGVL
ncbi:hypothetical protein ACVDFE_28580 [Lentzea chajnantorensis]